MRGKLAVRRRVTDLKKTLENRVYGSGWQWLFDWLQGATEPAQSKFLAALNQRYQKRQLSEYETLEELHEAASRVAAEFDKDRDDPSELDETDDGKHLLEALFLSAVHCRKRGKMFTFEEA